MAVFRKKLTGIEVGSKNIKMVKIGSSGKVLRYSEAMIPEGVVTEGKIESEKLLANTIKSAKKKLKLTHKKCAVCISNPDIVIRQMSMPVMEHKNILENISLELSGFLPVSPENYVIDYVIRETVENEDKKQLNITVYAMPIKIVKMYSDCVKEAGFKIKYIDIVENAYSKMHSYLLDKKITAKNDFACLYIDNSKSSLSVYKDAKLYLNKTLDTGVMDVFERISAKTGKTSDEVKDVLFSGNIFTQGDKYSEEKRIIEDFSQEISHEAVRVIDFYKSRNKNKNIDFVYLSGCFSHVSGIDSFLKEAIGIQVEYVDKYLDVFFKSLPPKNTGADYTNAFAVTFRQEGKND